ncbi:MAG: peptidoglycan DD-metalloendopeptidase family protein [Bacteroidales bacterium]|nr:peptidoglycan DD-metalloendopeptidase family protein [Bacteroidales bacterium]
MRYKFRLLFIALAAIMCMAGTDIAWSQKKKKSSKKAPDIESVSAEKKKNEQSMRNTSAQIEAKKAEINRQLSRLNNLNAEIEENRRTLDRLSVVSDSITQLAEATADSVTVMSQQVEDLRKSYVESLRRLQPYDRSRTTMSFIFSSKDFVTLQRRLRYLKQFSLWRQKRADAMTASLDSLESKRRHLTLLEQKSTALIQRTAEAQERLDSNRKGAEEIVESLRKDEKSLRAVLEQQKQQARILDQRLDKLIAEEQARIAREQEAERKRKAESARTKSDKGKTKESSKPATTPAAKTPVPAATPVRPSMTEASDVENLGGTFAQNKGKLPFPITGKYRIIGKFGRQAHPSLPKVEIENSGIDIETAAGASARAVFEGKVSAIFKEDGYNSIVMIRHGSYITIYAGIDNVSVKSGEKIKAGQTIGKVNTDATRGIPVLHFEIRNERTKLNPLQWIGH